MLPKVAIIILNWQNAPDTIACLQSLQTVAYTAFTVLVVDNGSKDSSVAQIQSIFPNVEILQTGDNLGYAGGNNVGIQTALARRFEYICVINNDVILEPETITTLVDLLETKTVDVVTPLIVKSPQDNIVWALGLELNHKSGQVSRIGSGNTRETWFDVSPFTVDAVSGAMFVARRDVFEQAGLLDEKFFLYYEEVDWSLRARATGFIIQAVPQAVARHEVSATLGAASPLIDYYMLRNQLYLIRKHWSAPTRWRLYGRVILRNLLAILAFTVKPHKGKRLPNRNARLYALRDAALGRWGKRKGSERF